MRHSTAEACAINNEAQLYTHIVNLFVIIIMQGQGNAFASPSGVRLLRLRRGDVQMPSAKFTDFAPFPSPVSTKSVQSTFLWSEFNQAPSLSLRADIICTSPQRSHANQ